MTNIFASFHIFIFPLYLENPAHFHAFNLFFTAVVLKVWKPHFDTKFIFLHPALHPRLLF